MNPIRSIVVPTDFSPLAEAAAVRAASLARLDGGAVHLVHALAVPLLTNPYEYSVPADLWNGLREAAREKIEQAREAVQASGVQTVTAEVSELPDPIAAIEEAVCRHRPDLVVMGTHGRGGIQHAFLGSVAERALRKLDVPILAVKEDPEAAAKPIAKIALAVDFSPHSERAVELAEELAARLSASVEVIHALHLPVEIGYLAKSGAELQRAVEAHASEHLAPIRERLERRGVRAAIHLGHGHPDAVIADRARRSGCQLVVMGTRGRTGLAHVMLGSIAERTLRAAPCSVLCVGAARA